MADGLDVPAKVKRCNGCGAAKPCDAFHIRRKSPDGLSRLCHDCQREHGRKHRERYREINLRRDPRAATPTKRCCRCKEVLPSERFDISRSKKDGLADKCRQCKVEYERDRHFASQGVPRRRRMLAVKFGMTLEEYEALFEKQDGLCAICGTSEPGGRFKSHLSVDHDHRTGRVRGLLCGPCNTALGLVKDDPARLRAAANYLDEAR